MKNQIIEMYVVIDNLFLKCAVISTWRDYMDNIIFLDCADIRSFERDFDNVFLEMCCDFNMEP